MTLHFSHIFLTEGFTFIVNTPFLFCTPCYTSLGGVVYRHLDRDLVTYEYPDVVLSELARYMSGYDHIVGQLNLEGSVRKCIHNYSLKLDNVILRQNNPSYLSSFT